MYLHTDILHRYCDSLSLCLLLYTTTHMMFFSPHKHTHTHIFKHVYTHVPHIDVKWPDRAACKQAIRLDSERGATLSDMTGPIPLTHTHTHWEDSESWALDLLWQQRLLLSLTSDPFLPVVASSFAPPCPSLSCRTNVIEVPRFGQAVAPLHHARQTHMHSDVSSHTHSYKSKPCQALRCRCKWTCGHRGRQRADKRAEAYVFRCQQGTTSPCPPCVWQHWPFSPSSLTCVSVCLCVRGAVEDITIETFSVVGHQLFIKIG